MQPLHTNGNIKISPNSVNGERNVSVAYYANYFAFYTLQRAANSIRTSGHCETPLSCSFL